MKKKLTLSVDPDIYERLQAYANEHHATMSAVVTQWVLTLKVRDPQLRGQTNLKDFLK